MRGCDVVSIDQYSKVEERIERRGSRKTNHLHPGATASP